MDRKQFKEMFSTLLREGEIQIVTTMEQKNVGWGDEHTEVKTEVIVDDTVISSSIQLIEGLDYDTGWSNSG